MNKTELIKRYLFFLAGLFVNSFGVAFITKADLGTSPISSIPYTLSLGFRPTLGMFTLYMSLVLIAVQGLRRVNGSLLPEYTEEEFQEATFSFVKYYVQSRHYDDLVAENEKLKKDLNAEIAWRTRVSDI